MLTSERLFDETPYDYHFNAVITAIGDDYIVLDKTLFYPFSGNQNYDVGYIDNIPVTAVYFYDEKTEEIDFSAPIKHVICTEGFEIGQQVSGKIDKDIRLNTMRLHTASHIVEYFVSKLSGFLSAEGSFVNHEKDRTDYSFSNNIEPQELISLQKDVNEFLSHGHPIIFTQRNGLRIWQCADIEMPCCGTHVSNTREVGDVVLTRKNKGKGINRIETRLA